MTNEKAEAANVPGTKPEPAKAQAGAASFDKFKQDVLLALEKAEKELSNAYNDENGNAVRAQARETLRKLREQVTAG